MKPVRIALPIDLTLHHFRCILRGIKEYAATRPNWMFLPMPATPQQLEGVRSSPPDGVIAQVFAPELAAPLKALKRPVVNVSRSLRKLPFPRVGSDEAKVGILVAEHLLGRGYRHFGFVGHLANHYAAQRVVHFRRVLQAAGCGLTCYDIAQEMTMLTRSPPWSLDVNLRRWLSDLPKPVAIFAANDQSAVQLLEVCYAVGLRVPEDVAVVGVDNDELLCDLARPSLSSVALPGERIGYEAAALLDRLMRGKGRCRKTTVLPPIGLVVRQSSNLLAIDDADVAAALRFIHDHAHRPLRIADVLREVAVSRRGLERRFRRTLKRTLGEEIRRVHVERAKDLLAGAELPIAHVAVQAGFSDHKQLCVVFRQETGHTPSSYRRLHRTHGILSLRQVGGVRQRRP